MKLIYKKVGQTPLEALDEFRQSNPLFKDEKLSYIGRLDPMAEGEMIVLIGREENQKRDEYLHFDKEYLAEFLVGFSTDTGDLLGLVHKISDENILNNNDFSKKIPLLSQKLLSLTNQKFPWFSSRHVLGIALFDWFKSGRAHEIDRPSKDIKIYSVEMGDSRPISSNELLKYLTENIGKVKGDFRQSEILKKWQGILETSASQFPIFSLKLKVSTGTYIRGLTEEIEKEIGFPVVLFSLKRINIFLDN